MPHGTAYTTRTLGQIIRRTLKQLKINITPYQLMRHSVLTQAALRGVKPREIQKYAGHTKLTTTEKYTSLDALETANVQTTAEVVSLHNPEQRKTGITD